MMENDTVFRFASLRPAQSRTRPSDRVIESPSHLSDPITDTIITSDDKRKARREVGKDIVNHNEFISNSVSAYREMFRTITPRIQVVLGRASKDDDTALVDRDFVEALANANELSGRERDDRTHLQETVWRSYFGTVLIGEGYGAARSKLVDWIRFLYAFDNSVRGGSEFPAALRAAAKRRPEIPYEWFSTKARGSDDPKISDSENTGELKARVEDKIKAVEGARDLLETRTEKMKQAHKKISLEYEQRLAQASAKPAAADPKGHVDWGRAGEEILAVQGRIVETFKEKGVPAQLIEEIIAKQAPTAISLVRFSNETKADPYRFDDDDFSKDKALKEAVLLSGLSERSRIPDVLHGLDVCIAKGTEDVLRLNLAVKMKRPERLTALLNRVEEYLK